MNDGPKNAEPQGLTDFELDLEEKLEDTWGDQQEEEVELLKLLGDSFPESPSGPTSPPTSPSSFPTPLYTPPITPQSRIIVDKPKVSPNPNPPQTSSPLANMKKETTKVSPTLPKTPKQPTKVQEIWLRGTKFIQRKVISKINSVEVERLLRKSSRWVLYSFSGVGILFVLLFAIGIYVPTSSNLQPILGAYIDKGSNYLLHFLK
jgi:hypothetical protein